MIIFSGEKKYIIFLISLQGNIMKEGENKPLLDTGSSDSEKVIDTNSCRKNCIKMWFFIQLGRPTTKEI